MRFFLLFLLIASNLLGDIQKTLTSQGYLSDSDGRINGTKLVTFHIFDSADVNSSPTPLFSEEQNISFFRGAYSATIGLEENNSLDLSFDRQYWLGIQVGDQNLSTRKKLSAVPYALNVEPLRIRVESNVSRINGLISELDLNLSNKIITTENTLSTRLSDENTSIRNLVSTTDTKLANRLSDENTSIRNLVSTTDTKLATRLSDENTSIRNLIVTTETTIYSALNSAITVVNTDIANLDSNFSKKLRDENSSIRNLITTTVASYDSDSDSLVDSNRVDYNISFILNSTNTESNRTINALAIGKNTVANSDEVFVIGRNNENNISNSLFVVGNGISDTNRTNILVVTDENISVFGKLIVENIEIVSEIENTKTDLLQKLRDENSSLRTEISDTNSSLTTELTNTANTLNTTISEINATYSTKLIDLNSTVLSYSGKIQDMNQTLLPYDQKMRDLNSTVLSYSGKIADLNITAITHTAKIS
ncbi:hypothetical protein ThvES_00018850, partial [Thiovulum sp. ES]